MLLVRAVEVVLDPGGRSRSDRGQETGLTRSQRGTQVLGVRRDRILSDVADLTRGAREVGGGAAGADTAVGISVGGGEARPIAAVREAREPHLTRFRPHRLLREDVLAREGESAHPLERVAPPRTVVDRARHRLAELTVARLRDADLALPVDDVAHRLGEQAPVLRRRLQREAVLSELARGIRGDEGIGAGQASGGGGLDRGHAGDTSEDRDETPIG